MDRTSTLVLEGKADSFPMLHVNDSATLDGTPPIVLGGILIRL